MEGKSPIRRDILPERIFVAPEALDDPLTQRVLSRLGPVPVTYLEQCGDPLTQLDISELVDLPGRQLSEAEKFSLGKKYLLLTRYQGKWLKRCPGTSDHVCCNLWVVNPAQGCPLDCTYCCLQYYLKRNPTLKMFTNTKDMISEIRSRVESEPKRYFRICTGELTDSLVWDSLSDLTLELVPFFSRLENATLELKTKDAFVDNLLSLKTEHRGRTVVSWSVNAPEVIRNDEALSVSLEERVCAAKKVIEAGYRVGLHFDPLVHFAGWEDAYSETVKYIFSEIDPARVAWVSVSPLRYHPEQQKMMLERFPVSKLPFGEQFVGSDNKLRIIQPLRFKMIRFVWQAMKAIKSDMPVYLCMESAAAWRSVSGGPPSSDAALASIYSRRKASTDHASCACACV